MKRTKKVVSLVMLTGMLSFSMMGSALAAPAKDIQGHWAEKTIQDWVQKGWIQGYSDGSVKPDRTISRIELVVLVNKAFQFEGKNNINFTDVSEKDWFYNDLQKASAAGYILGYEDGSFKPNQQISRQEIAVIMSRILKLSVSLLQQIHSLIRKQVQIGAKALSAPLLMQRSYLGTIKRSLDLREMRPELSRL